VTEAFHDAKNAPGPCMEDTREKLIADISAWFNNSDPSCERAFWLNGLAGTGKSAVARTIADRAQQQGRLAATFFFSRNSAGTREPSAIIPTIAYQMALCLPSIRLPICAALDSDRHVRDRGVAVQTRILLDNMSSAAVPNGPFLVVLDALDECHLENGRPGGDAVPNLLEKFGSLGSIKFLITSRVEAPIRRMFDSLTSQVALHDIEKSIVQKDIHRYLDHSFAELARDRQLALPFPSGSELDEVVRRAGSLFVYAATVAKWISQPEAQPLLRLREVLDKDEDEVPYQHKFLDDMYSEILMQAAKTSSNPRKHECALKNVISTVVLLQEPVPASALAVLAGEEIRTAALLPLLSAVLLVDESAPVRLFHPSFPEFILSEERCQDKRFLVRAPEDHLHLAVRCLEVLNVHLQENICNIKDPSLPNTEVHLLQQTLEVVAPAELRYACKHWHAHLRLADATSSGLVNTLKTFCTTHLLHWLELLSLLNELPAAQAGIRLLLAYLRVCTPLSSLLRTSLINYALQSCPECLQASLVILLTDTEHLLSEYREPLDSHALHVYHSAVVTMPTCPLLGGHVSKCVGIPSLRTPRPQGWIPQHLKIQGHKGTVNSVAFSPNGQLIVSGSRDKTVRVWDATTGVQRHIMRGHEDWVWSVTFSPNGQLIASGSDDRTARVWDASTGAERHIMHGHESGVLSVAFSRNSQLIVSGSRDKTVRVWDASTGAERHIMHGHKSEVYSVAFSPNGHFIVSGSDDKTVRVWDATTGTERHIVHGHKGVVSSVAFSPDGQSIVSGSQDKTARVWDATTGVQRHIMHGHESGVLSVAFSRNSQLIVSGSRDKTVRVWDATTGAEPHITHGHEGEVYSVAFSPNGQLIVSGSDDKIVRVWDATTGAERHTMHGHEGVVFSVAFSPNGQLVVSGSYDKTVRVWDASTGAERHTIHGHEDCIYSVAFSPDSRFIVSGSDDTTIRVWDASTGAERHTIHGHEDDISSVAFSPNGQLIASGSDDRTVRVWDATTGTERHIMRGHGNGVSSVAFSPNGQVIVSGSDDKTIRVWDVTTGAERHTLRGHKYSVDSVAFSPDGQLVISRSIDRTVRVWDVSTGAEQHAHPDLDTSPTEASRTILADYRTGWVWGVAPSGTWQQMCWLPKQYPGDQLAQHGQTVCIGGQNGAITILDFADVPFSYQ
jgi:WD40 repeat protein